MKDHILLSVVILDPEGIGSNLSILAHCQRWESMWTPKKCENYVGLSLIDLFPDFYSLKGEGPMDTVYDRVKEGHSHAQEMFTIENRPVWVSISLDRWKGRPAIYAVTYALDGDGEHPSGLELLSRALGAV